MKKEDITGKRSKCITGFVSGRAEITGFGSEAWSHVITKACSRIIINYISSKQNRIEI
jgi:hypothetical protein